MKDALEIVNQTLSAFWVESSFGFVCIRARRPGPRSGTTVYWPLCTFAHFTVAYWSDKKTRISTGLLLPSGNCARENGARPNVLYAGKTLHSCFVWGCRHLVLCSNQDRWTFSSLWSVSRYRHRVQARGEIVVLLTQCINVGIVYKTTVITTAREQILELDFCFRWILCSSSVCRSDHFWSRPR